MQIKPVNKQIILIIPKEEEEKVISGIIVPASALQEEKPYLGTVFASDHEDYKTGDVLLYRKFSGFEFKHEGEGFLVIEAGDVLVKLIED